MKGVRKILFKSFFLLAVSLSLGINSYSNYTLLHINDISACTNNVENSFSSHIDSPNEDQIGQSDNSDLSQEQFSLIPPGRAYFSTSAVSFSVWQPPKIS